MTPMKMPVFQPHLERGQSERPQPWQAARPSATVPSSRGQPQRGSDDAGWEEVLRVAVLFVCLGNICRSAAAEGVLRALAAAESLADRIEVASAATHDYQIGRPPDPRAQAIARARGIDISAQRARQADADDFRRFDYVLAMDRANLADLRRICPPDAQNRLHRFLDFAPALGVRDVPDPYYGDERDFVVMMDLIEAGARGLLAHLRRNELAS